ESLAPGHPAHDYFKARQSGTLRQFAGLADGRVADPHGLAVQVVAMMDGLQIQWLREPETFDLVSAWEAAAVKLF
ncbi:MAG TPA: TetR/AcrR family transcriptional regulator, partial [Actinoplanes sp.]|nr:TetR/AcrR family transcriptional regulator [Actinoplanes sp.]